MKERVCVVMPTYNERENLEPTLGELFARNPGVDVLIVDDGSPDGTGHLADLIAEATAVDLLDDDGAACPVHTVSNDSSVHTSDIAIANRLRRCINGSRLFVMHRKGKLGLGSAYIDGFTWALGQEYDLICEMDMDGSHRPEDLSRMLEFMETHPDIDLTLGSRRVAGGQTEDWPWYRDFISRAGSMYARFMLGLHVKDMTCGFRVYRARILRALPLRDIRDNGYVFQIDMTRQVVGAGGRVVELPIVFPERVRGESKMTGSIVREAMIQVTKWGFQRLVPRR
ncbi:polyprenol monophosphomannose synthase [Bifidobacterium choloepi]|uniref:Polyprenol monophosphomannose synthase n=1 Tax=Bifidobacterium choloepi TaxID=2614131 RepID=A0A6I5N1N5_9BIFI|nr:polyprenol monophosphomannose synthase [Bifidobacterium choloepi]NEG70386.1 polyprenol monophosphomannose synthase [Bifidobacterium choloepi]